MIALCEPHHAAADRGAYSRAYLRTLKNKGGYDERELRGAFPWAEKEILVRLGRFYFGGGSALGPVRAAPILTLERATDGLLSMSFDLVDKDGKQLAAMRKNEWTCDPALVHDLTVNTAGTSIRIWHGTRDIGFQMSFSRLPKPNFERLLETDSNDSREKLDKEVTKWLGRREVDAATEQVIRDAVERLKPAIDVLPGGLADAYRRIPTTIDAIRNWAKANATDAEGNVTILNIENLVAWNSGRAMEIRNSNLCGVPVVVDTLLSGGFTAVFP
jgi:hypothetical protein